MSKPKLEYTGLRLEMARRRVGRTQLAERLGVHPNTVSNWLVGNNDPGLASAIEALRALGMSDEQIFEMRLGELVEQVSTNGAAS